MNIPEAGSVELADAVLRTARRLRRANAEELDGLAVNPHQARALRSIARFEPVRMADLADRLHVAARSATEVVDFLVAGGWVARAPDPADRRARLLSLTDEGRALLAEVVAARQRAADVVLRGVDPTLAKAAAEALTPTPPQLENGYQ